MTALLLEATDVAKSFDGVAALKAVSFGLRAGSVHALCGGNGAGKSTFLGVLMGLLRRDSGDIRIHGRHVDFKSPAEALQHRVAIVTQELSPVPEMTVAENIFLGQEPRLARWLVDRARIRRDARELLERLKFPIDADARMSSLSLASIQLVEIARALRKGAEILILDEPTSAIGEKEVQALFQVIRNLAQAGTGVIYVSHRLSEIFDIADWYTVFRDGRFIESGAIASIDHAHLVRAIVAREAVAATPRTRCEAAGATLLETHGLSRAGEFEDIALELRAGEVVGIYGLMGSGRTELVECIYGLTRPGRGEVVLAGRPLPQGQPQASIEQGMVLVTEDRKDSGLVLQHSISRNTTLSMLGRLQSFGWIRRAAERRMVADLVERLGVKAASVQLPVSSLSGGNQQKVVVARCLSSEPQVLLCDEPTRGMDEGAKQDIYRIVRAFTAQAQGAALVVSSEIPEILQLCDRVLVLRRGRIVATLDVADADAHLLTRLAG